MGQQSRLDAKFNWHILSVENNKTLQSALHSLQKLSTEVAAES